MTFAERLQRDSAIWELRHTSSSKFLIINLVTAPELSASTIGARMSARSGPHWRCGQSMCAHWSRAASVKSYPCSGGCREEQTEGAGKAEKAEKALGRQQGTAQKGAWHGRFV